MSNPSILPYFSSHKHEGEDCDGCIRAKQHEEIINMLFETNRLLSILVDETRNANLYLENLENKLEGIRVKNR